MEGITINLKNLIYHILKKWRIFLVGILIGAVLADLAGVVLSYHQVTIEKAVLDKKEADEKKMTDVAELRNRLSEKEIMEVESAVDSYFAFVKTNEAQLTYYNDSFLMQMDANEVPTLILHYFIDNFYEVEYPVMSAIDNTYDIAIALGRYASSGDVCAKICKKLKWEKEIAYIQELITYKCEGHSLTITVVAPKEDNCREIGEIIKTELQSVASSLKDVYGDFDVKLAMEEYVVKASTDLVSQQITQLTNIYSGRNDFRTSITSFTEGQKAYYQAVINNYFDENNSLLDDSMSNDYEVEDEEKIVENLSVQLFHVKFVFLGIIAGFVFCVAWICVQYITSGMLLSKEDIQEGCNLSVIGTIKKDPNAKKQNVIDCLIERIFRSKGLQFSQNEQLCMLATAIRIAVEKADMRSLFISSAANNEEMRQIENALVLLLCQQGVNVMTGTSVAYDPESLERMSACDGVVLVEGVGFSLFKDIMTEKQLCERGNVKIIGTVVVE